MTFGRSEPNGYILKSAVLPGQPYLGLLVLVRNTGSMAGLELGVGIHQVEQFGSLVVHVLLIQVLDDHAPRDGPAIFELLRLQFHRTGAVSGRRRSGLLAAVFAV